MQGQGEQLDDELLRRCVLGDTGSFAILIQRHQERLLRYAARMLGNDTETAADVVQEAFLRLWEYRARYEGRGKLLSYLLHVTHNICLDTKRSEKARPCFPLEEGRDISAPSSDALLAQALADAVASLSPQPRTVFILSEYEGFRYDEIAEVLGIPAGTVASRKHEAVSQLRRRLCEWVGK